MFPSNKMCPSGVRELPRMDDKMEIRPALPLLALFFRLWNSCKNQARCDVTKGALSLWKHLQLLLRCFVLSSEHTEVSNQASILEGRCKQSAKYVVFRWSHDDDSVVIITLWPSKLSVFPLISGAALVYRAKPRQLLSSQSAQLLSLPYKSLFTQACPRFVSLSFFFLVGVCCLAFFPPGSQHKNKKPALSDILKQYKLLCFSCQQPTSGRVLTATKAGLVLGNLWLDALHAALGEIVLWTEKTKHTLTPLWCFCLSYFPPNA